MQSTQAPTKDEFAQLMISALHSAGQSPPIDYERSSFVLRADGDHQLFLSRCYAEYCDAREAARPHILMQYAHALVSPHEIPDTYALARPKLLPQVETLHALHDERLDLQSGKLPPHEIFGDIFGIRIAYALTDTITSIPEKQFSKWNMGFANALSDARQNLRKISNEPFRVIRPGLYVSDWRDNFDAARIILSDVVRDLSVSGDHVAIIPDRDHLFVTGSDDEDGLKHMANEAKRVYSNSTRSITGRAIRLSRDHCIPFILPSKHPAYRQFRLLEYCERKDDYDSQLICLDNFYRKTEACIFVAGFSLNEKDISSCCVWTADIEISLPRTDYIGFVRTDPTGRDRVYGVAPWTKVLATMGNLMRKEPDMKPERFRVEQFPSRKQLAQMEVDPRGRAVKVEPAVAQRYLKARLGHPTGA